MGRVRSWSSPLTRATMAASASRGLMDLATSRGVMPDGRDCLLPSGRVISMLLIGKIFSVARGVVGGGFGQGSAYAQGGSDLRAEAGCRLKVFPTGIQKGLQYFGLGGGQGKPYR